MKPDRVTKIMNIIFLFDNRAKYLAFLEIIINIVMTRLTVLD